MRYLVTGGAGFIASHLLPELLPHGQVAVLDDFSTGKRERLDRLDVQLFEGDVADPVVAARAVRGADVVFHLAANPSVAKSLADPLATGHANDMGTISILHAAQRAGARSCVFTSSCAVYGGGQPPCVESMPVDPLSPYAASKLAGEAYMLSAARSSQLRTVSLRLFNVYGPGQDPDVEYAAVIPKFIERLQAGVPPTIFGDGSQTRDFVHVADVARGLIAAARIEVAPPHPINLGTGKAVSLLQLIEILGRVAGTDASPEFAPARVGEVLHSFADNTAAARWLDWTPTVALEDGLRSMIEIVR
jgi:UDP-glucose 4-epimerase